jgi:hypothetical protein
MALPSDGVPMRHKFARFFRRSSFAAHCRRQSVRVLPDLGRATLPDEPLDLPVG